MIDISCPVPSQNFDIITLGHGSGGLLQQRLLQSEIFNILSNDALNVQHDGAILKVEGQLAFSTDSFVVTPIFFPGGSIGELAVNGTVNDLAMCGAKPLYLSLSFIIEEGLPVHELKAIIAGVKAAADKAGVKIVTGDTKVVEKGKADKIFINTSGIGQVLPEANIHHNRIQPGDAIILSGNMATHGMAIMSVRKGLEFESAILSDTINLNEPVEKLIKHYGHDVRFLRDPTRGGVASVLNEVASQTNLCFKLEENLLPVDSQVAAACEILGLDPLYVANEGIFVAIVKHEIAGELVELLRSNPNCTGAAVIGNVTNDHPGKVLMHGSIGGTRVINYLTGEQLPRIC